MGTRPAPPTLVSLRPSACPKLLRRLTKALPPRRRSQDKFFAWANVNSLTELMNIEEGERTELRPKKADETMLERYKQEQECNSNSVHFLKNKPPKWNEQVGAYVLNFNGRVTRASVKNFQLYNPAVDQEAVVMQFGRVGKDAFTMDYQHPLCALQAFGIALSSFDYKIACE